MSTDTNGWNEWSKHVLLELERLDSTTKELKLLVEQSRRETLEQLDNKCQNLLQRIDAIQERLSEKYTDLHGSVVALRVQMALIGAISGVIASGVVSFLVRIFSK
jgi:predicted ATP-dependent serine protease